MSRHKQKHGLKLRSLFLWHRYFGLSAALFVLVLACTGLLLNHTATLGLNNRYISSEAIHDWYGIKPPSDTVSFQAGTHWVSQLGDILYFDNRQLTESSNGLLGFVLLRDFMVVAVEQELLLLSTAGKVIEHLKGMHGVPAGMQAIGIDREGNFVVQGNHGNYVVDENFIEWASSGADEISWSRLGKLPRSLYDQLVRLYRSSDLTVERVVLDLHSGRIVGNWGVFLMDGAALLMFALAITGVWHWARRKR